MDTGRSSDTLNSVSYTHLSIVPNYISGFIYGSLVESYSCEQNSRMLAMQSRCV